MNTNGVMAEIRRLLNKGKSSGEVIALGYAPSSVYKAQRQLRKDTHQPARAAAQVVVTNMASEGWAELKEENTRLQQQQLLLEERAAERDTLDEQLVLAQARIEGLEDQAKEVRQLREQLAVLEPEARAAVDLRERVRELEHQMERVRRDTAQDARRWQRALEEEQGSRQDAQSQATRSRAEKEQLQAQYQELVRAHQGLPERLAPLLWERIQPLQQELETLRPLKVWVGHPCARCGKPTSGVPSREVAARLLREGGYGHGHCVNKRP